MVETINKSSDIEKLEAVGSRLSTAILVQLTLRSSIVESLRGKEDEGRKWKAFGYIYGLVDFSYQALGIATDKLHKDYMFSVFRSVLSPDPKLFPNIPVVCSPEKAVEIAILVNQKMLANDKDVLEGINAGAEEYRRLLEGLRSHGLTGLLELFS